MIPTIFNIINYHWPMAWYYLIHFIYCINTSICWIIKWYNVRLLIIWININELSLWSNETRVIFLFAHGTYKTKVFPSLKPNKILNCFLPFIATIFYFFVPFQRRIISSLVHPQDLCWWTNCYNHIQIRAQRSYLPDLLVC